MKQCNVCAQTKDNLTLTYVITKQNTRKDIQICRTCINHVCDEIQKGEWFPLQSTDETVRLPNAFYTKS